MVYYPRDAPYVKNGAYRRKSRYNTAEEIYALCNRLGSEGWQLVGVSQLGSDVTFAFKRPKE